MDQYWNAYSYCGADPVNYVDEWGLDGASITAPSLSMSENATSLSAQAGVTWGATNTNNGPSLSYGGMTVGAYCSKTMSNVNALGAIMAQRASAYANDWDGKFDVRNPEVPRAEPKFDPFVHTPPNEEGIIANPLFDPTGLAAGGLKLGAKAGLAAATLARDAAKQLAKGVGKNVAENTAKNVAKKVEPLIFESTSKHGITKRGNANPEPTNPQDALNNSIELPGNTSRRVAVDKNAGEFAVFDEHLPGRFHGHSRTWSELDQSMQSILRKAGLVTKKGKIK